MREQQTAPLSQDLPCVNPLPVLTEQEIRDGWVVSRSHRWYVKVLRNDRTKRILTGQK